MQKQNKTKEGKRLLLMMALSFTSACCLYAQTQVSGVVKDASSEPMIGVSVVVKGSTQSAITNEDGRYTIAVPAGEQALTFSFLGMKTVTHTVSGSVMDVTLEEDSQLLEEVVMIGYGTVKKRDLTGAVSSVSAKEISAIPVSSAAEAMAGKMAGVQIITTEGTPDAEVKIRVRGGGSITQDNSPLYIVDGFPVSSISDVSPNDIASIDVLKDASSTAIYGARGANGVIIITTKEGSEGRTTISFNAYAGFKNVTKNLDVLSPYEFVLSQAELIGATSSDFTKYFGEYGDLDLYTYQKGTNWQNELLGRTATTQSYNLSITGGNVSNKYNLGLSRTNEDGVMINSGFERTSLNFRFNSKISNRLKLDFNVRMAYTGVDGPGLASSGQVSSARLKHAIQFRPTMGIASFSPEVDESLFDDMSRSSSLYNPVDVANDDYQRQTRLNTAFNGAFSWNIIDNLTYRLDVGYIFGNNRTNRVYGPFTSESQTNGRGKPIGQIGQSASEAYRISNTLTYDVKQLGKEHSLTILLGQELNSDWSKSTTLRAEDFSESMVATEVLAKMRLGTPTITSTSESPDHNLSSFFGRINYTFKDRYLLTGTLRADGSSKFAAGNQWGYFPSVAAAWRISDESFMASTTSWLSNLKLRASYGAAGNNRIGDDLWKLTYGTTTSGKDYYVNEVLQSRLVPGSVMSNPDLRWETTITRNAGLDMGFFNSRLTAILDLYWNTTKDLLISARIPSSTGYSTQMQNIGQTSNKGVELTLNATILETRNFTLNASFNIAFNKNNVDKLGEEKILLFNSGWHNTNGPGDDFIVMEGQPLGKMYGYVYDGYYRFEDFIWDGIAQKWILNDDVANNATVSGATLMPGAIKYKKIADDGTLVIGGDEDKTIIGDANPLHTGGFSLNAIYKGFDAAVFFNWSYGNDIYNANRVLFTTGYESSRRYMNILDEMNSSNRFMYIDPATGEDIRMQPERLIVLNENATVHSSTNSRARLTSYAIEDGSFLRLNTATIGYTFPSEWTRKAFIQSLRIYVTGYNLFIWTNYSGYDPEVDSRRSQGPMTPGVDFSAYPRSRTFVAGINLTF
jgi:TonB-linked SusC/RagA family outer membrane protein